MLFSKKHVKFALVLMVFAVLSVSIVCASDVNSTDTVTTNDAGDAIELKDGENTYLNARLDFYNSMLNYNTIAASLEKEIGIPLVFSDELILKITEEDL